MTTSANNATLERLSIVVSAALADAVMCWMVLTAGNNSICTILTVIVVILYSLLKIVPTVHLMTGGFLQN